MSTSSVHLVVQRYRSCKILIEENEWVSVPSQPSPVEHCGLLVYVSFATSEKPLNLPQVADAILTLPVLTTGLWGDGISSTVSIKDLASSGQHRASIVVVPQANLISKLRGKQLQYHGQVGKEAGKDLYHKLVDCIRGCLLELQCEHLQKPLPGWYQHQKEQAFNGQTNEQWSQSLQLQPSPSTPPELIFKDSTKYCSWDDKGIPLTNTDGEAVTKSALKKLTKLYEAHRKRHEKWRANHPEAETTTALIQQPPPQDNNSFQAIANNEMDHCATNQQWSDALDGSFCQIVAGSFGRRQGLEFESDMGPFCHVLQL